MFKNEQKFDKIVEDIRFSQTNPYIASNAPKESTSVH